MAESQISRPKRQGKKTKTYQLSGWYYLSFVCDQTRLFLGAAIVEANEIEQAAARAWELDINPGGEVLGCTLLPRFVPKTCFLNRLLTSEEVRIAFPSGIYSFGEGRAVYAVN